MSSGSPAATQEHLERNALGTPGVVFLVLAAAAPMGAMLGALPFVIALGNGPGAPGTYLFAALALACFAAGYAAMSRRITNAGAFYAYIARGIGRPFGVGAAFVALISYPAVAIGVFTIFGIYGTTVFADQFGIHMAWYTWSLLAIGVVGLLAFSRIELSARVLAVFLIAEVLVLTVMNVSVLADKGLSAFSLDVFSPSTVFSGSAGVAMLFAFNSFIGFEGTAIYGEETRDPKRTVARATYWAIGLIGVFYAVTSWSIVSYYGNDAVQAVAAEDPEGFIFGLTLESVGEFAFNAMQVLLVMSFFASALGILNSAARYFFALGREGVIPRVFGQSHPRFESPWVGVLIVVAAAVLLVSIMAIGGGDPYLGLAATALALGTIGIVALQAGAAISASVFFARERDPQVVTHILLPAVGAIALLVACYLGIDNYGLLTGTESGWQNQLPWLLLIAAVVGIVQGYRLRASSPDVYGRLGGSVDDAGSAQGPER